MKARAFNRKGMQQFKIKLQDLRQSNCNVAQITNLALDKNLTVELPVNVNLDQKNFTTKHEVGEYFWNKLKQTKANELLYNGPFWSWASAYYFDSLATDNKKALKMDEYYILWEPDNYLRAYKHFLRNPFDIYRLYEGQRGLALVSAPCNKTFDLAEQIASRQEFFTSFGIISLVDHLYLEQFGKPMALKPGWSNKKPNNPGSLRRLVWFIYQLGLTHDVFSMSHNELASFLPTEYNHFKPKYLS